MTTAIPTATTEPTSCSSEHAAHQILRLAAEHPGMCGRLRIARVVGGYPVPHRDEIEAKDLARYSTPLDWPLREVVRLVDALIDGKLIAQTTGPRPTVVVTRAGHRALDALEHTSTPIQHTTI